ncbi:MAG TPA: hypothetical protein VLK33_21765 [Terriglobales bacterium]|nr:hypothetical protein [Terriglobales bacterium]
MIRRLRELTNAGVAVISSQHSSTNASVPLNVGGNTTKAQEGTKSADENTCAGITRCIKAQTSQAESYHLNIGAIVSVPAMLPEAEAANLTDLGRSPTLSVKSTPARSNTRSLHSADHRFAIIRSGRDDRVVEWYELLKSGLEWATRYRASLTAQTLHPRLARMEVRFTPEQEAQLSEMASHAGTDTEQLVKDAALRLLEQDTRFRAAVREGLAQADRGEFIEEEEMEARIERMLNS